MMTKRAIVPALCLAAALLAGCSQGAGSGDATTTGSAGQGSGSAAVAKAEAPQPKMSNWQDASFYERPVQEVAADLELLGFSQALEQFMDDPDYPYYNVAFEGEPADNPVEGSDSRVIVGLGVYNPQVVDGEEEVTLDTLADGTDVTSYELYFYFDKTDPSEYETLARQVADAMGCGAFTDSHVGALYDDGPEIGTFSGDGSFKGKDAEWSVFVATTSPDTDGLADPDKPTYASFGYYDASDQLEELEE